MDQTMQHQPMLRRIDRRHTGMMAFEAKEPFDTFIDSVFNFPTLSELYKLAALDGFANLIGKPLGP